MKKKISSLKKKYKEMTVVQQKFIQYIIIIKIAVLVIGAALLVLAWYLLMKK